MAVLNRSKPFGTVSGTGVKHAYEQDGKLFDRDGNELGAPKETPAPAKPVKAAVKAEPDQVDAQLNG